MDHDETLLQLIGGIYDCALNPDAWNAILPRIGAFVGGSGGASQVKTSGTSAAPSGSSAGGNQEKTKGCRGESWHCTPPPPKPGHTQPPCHGPHMGPNGVMIQCD
jgi:hypothetical protein